MWIAQITFFIVALLSFLFGLFIFLNPQRTFAWQKSFYALINWRIEPISLSKEIRNTKLMGLFLIGFVLVACFYKFIILTFK